jgi:hypothetical protein
MPAPRAWPDGTAGDYIIIMLVHLQVRVSGLGSTLLWTTELTDNLRALFLRTSVSCPVGYGVELWMPCSGVAAGWVQKVIMSCLARMFCLAISETERSPAWVLVGPCSSQVWHAMSEIWIIFQCDYVRWYLGNWTWRESLCQLFEPDRMIGNWAAAVDSIVSDWLVLKQHYCQSRWACKSLNYCM